MKRIVLVAMVLALAAAGCVRRSITVRTKPPGAIVYMNGEELGRTPVTRTFLHYGWHEFRIEKDNYEIIVAERELKAPFYQVFPLDFFFEVLWPQPLFDRQEMFYVLEPQRVTDEEKLLERAADMRRELDEAVEAELAGEAAPAEPSGHEAAGETIEAGPPTSQPDAD